jgi:2-polyprenyl-3-methyl-5-hydroxy-6-metoxy-1,4-benzoquinol methylase
LNKLRQMLFEIYDTHYLRENALSKASIDNRSYEQRMPDYEASIQGILSTLPSSSRILDVGCGVGFLLFWLERSNGNSFQLTGIDVSPAQLSLARKHLPNRVMLIEQDAANFLRNKNRAFDAVFCTDILEHVESDNELLELMQLIKNSLEPGGVVICQVPNMANLTSLQLRYIDLTHTRGFTGASLIQLLECSGFRECRVVDRHACDLTQWLRMCLEKVMHRAIYRICGVATERHFHRSIIAVGKAK